LSHYKIRSFDRNTPDTLDAACMKFFAITLEFEDSIKLALQHRWRFNEHVAKAR